MKNQAHGYLAEFFAASPLWGSGPEGPSAQGAAAANLLMSFLLDTNVSEWVEPRLNPGLMGVQGSWVFIWKLGWNIPSLFGR